MNTGTRIAIVRKAHSITQRELEQMCLLSQQTLSNIESGYREPTDGQLSNIKTALRWGDAIDVALDGLDAAINSREANDEAR